MVDERLVGVGSPGSRQSRINLYVLRLIGSFRSNAWGISRREAIGRSSYHFGSFFPAINPPASASARSCIGESSRPSRAAKASWSCWAPAAAKCRKSESISPTRADRRLRGVARPAGAPTRHRDSADRDRGRAIGRADDQRGDDAPLRRLEIGIDGEGAKPQADGGEQRHGSPRRRRREGNRPGAVPPRRSKDLSASVSCAINHAIGPSCRATFRRRTRSTPPSTDCARCWPRFRRSPRG